MKEKASTQFFMLFFGTLVMGAYLVYQSIQPTSLFAAFYFLALYFLKKSGLGPEFTISSEKNRFDLPEPEMVLAGQVLPLYDRKDQQEDRFLSHFDFKKVVKRKLFTFIFLGLAVVFLFLKGKVELNLTSAIPVICGFFIIKSIYIGHLLLPLALTSWSVVSHYDKESSSIPYVFFTLLLFATLKAMSEASGEHLKLKKSYFILPLVLMFLGVVYGATFFLPEKSLFDRDDQVESSFNPAKEALQISKARSQSLLANLQSLPSADSQNLKENIQTQLDKISHLEKTLSSQKLLSKDLESSKRLLENVLKETESLEKQSSRLKSRLLRREGQESSKLKDFEDKHDENQSQRMEDLKKQMEDNQNKIFKSQSEKQLQHDEVKELETVRENLKQKFEKMAQLSPSEKEDILKHVETKKAELGLLKSMNSPNESLDLQIDNIQKLEELAKKPEPSLSELQDMSKALKTSKSIASLKEEAKLQSNAKATVTEDILKPFKKNEFSFKRLIPLLVLFLVMAIVQYLMGKKGVKKIKTLDPDILPEMRQEWRALKKQKLSPREEIIHHYNLLHDVLQKVHYSSHETPPSCIVNEDMKDFNPKLETATFQVTELYTKCFYGNKDVSASSLKDFRKSMVTIMGVYGLN